MSVFVVNVDDKFYEVFTKTLDQVHDDSPEFFNEVPVNIEYLAGGGIKVTQDDYDPEIDLSDQWEIIEDPAYPDDHDEGMLFVPFDEFESSIDHAIRLMFGIEHPVWDIIHNEDSGEYEIVVFNDEDY